MNKRCSGPDFFRFYRKPSARQDEMTFQVVVEQTDLWITTRRLPEEQLVEAALCRVNELRAHLSAWILVQPEFAASLTPVDVPPHAPEIVRRMATAARVVGVGPMAAVAGAVAAMTAECLLACAPDVIVENGGDIMLHSTRERVVGLLPDPVTGVRLGLRLHPEDFPVSVCSSSARIGHSLSLGQGDLAVVRARDACLADAAVTAFANMLQCPEDVEKAANAAAACQSFGVEGFFAQCGGAVGIWGAMEIAAVG
jgi:ApbE superfamily uncharacterized protein (UPF0280 family)